MSQRTGIEVQLDFALMIALVIFVAGRKLCVSRSCCAVQRCENTLERLEKPVEQIACILLRTQSHIFDRAETKFFMGPN